MFDPQDAVELTATKSQELAELLRRRIQDGEFAVRERLPSERMIAAALRVSRATVRDAIALLGAQGYVEMRGPHAGAYVGDLRVPLHRWFAQMAENMDQFEDSMDFRIAVEARTASLAARRRTPEDLANMRSALELFSVELWSETYRTSNWWFHDAVDRAARSPLLERACRMARGQLWLPPPEHLDRRQVVDIHDMHWRIFHAIKDQDVSAASMQTEAHLEHARVSMRLMILTEAKAAEREVQSLG